MKAADGVQIAEDLLDAYKYASHFWDDVTIGVQPRTIKAYIQRISRAEERERVLREALNRIKAAVGTPTEAWHIANAALIAAPEQPDRGVCPDCKSTTRSFRGRRGDEHGEWVCDNEWHAPEQGKEAKS